MEKKFYNRKERKAIAKSLGLINKNESQKNRGERVWRSIQAGEQINQQYQMMVENEQRQQLVDIYAHATKHLAEGINIGSSKYPKKSTAHGEDGAKEIMENNYVLQEKRRLELINRKEKQKNSI